MSVSLDLELPRALEQADGLPSMPGVVVEVLRLAKDEEAGIPDFARVISGDPALAAKLLKVSNSSMFGIGQEVKTLDRACMVLGLKTVQLMALSFSLRASVQASDGPWLKEYWARSLISAVAGRRFSRHLNLGVHDEAFLCGLLSQLGHLVLMQCRPEEYGRMHEQCAGHWPSAELQKEVLGFECAAVGAALLKSWELPEPVYLSIALAERREELPDDCGEELRFLVQTLRHADLTARVFRDEGKGESLQALRESAAEAGLASAELSALLDGLEAEISETAALLDVDFEPDYSPADILEDARQQVMRISLGAAADLQQAERRAHNLESKNRELAERASTDELTGIPNRAGFDAVLHAELAARARQRKPKALGMVLIDADHFKQFNDTHGHRAGDQVLRTIGRTLDQVCRGTDVPARYGGEEFAVIAPEVTPEGLRILSERIRQAIEGKAIEFDGKTLQVTVSIGGACLAESKGPQDGDALVEAADQRLYEAKRAGRNRCDVMPDILRLARG